MEVVHELIFADAGDVSASTPLRPLRRDPDPDRVHHEKSPLAATLAAPRFAADVEFQPIEIGAVPTGGINESTAKRRSPSMPAQPSPAQPSPTVISAITLSEAISHWSQTVDKRKAVRATSTSSRDSE